MTHHPNSDILPAETRQKIISAAMRLFGKQGYSQTPPGRLPPAPGSTR